MIKTRGCIAQLDIFVAIVTSDSFPYLKQAQYRRFNEKMRHDSPTNHFIDFLKMKRSWKLFFTGKGIIGGRVYRKGTVGPINTHTYLFHKAIRIST